MCVGKLTINGSDNGLLPGRRQAIIWTNAGILLIGPLGTNFSEILIRIQTFSFKKLHLKMSSAKWRLFCLGLNELRQWYIDVSVNTITAIVYIYPKLDENALLRSQEITKCMIICVKIWLYTMRLHWKGWFSVAMSFSGITALTTRNLTT